MVNTQKRIIVNMLAITVGIDFHNMKKKLKLFKEYLND